GLALLSLVVAKLLHVLDVALDLLALRRRDALALGQVVLEGVDRFLGLALLLVTAPDVAQIDRVQRLGVELREDLDRLVVARRREGLPRLELGLLLRVLGRECGGCHAQTPDQPEHNHQSKRTRSRHSGKESKTEHAPKSKWRGLRRGRLYAAAAR